MSNTKRVVVNHSHTYETNLDLKVGDTVTLPTPSWLRDVKPPTWEGEVTSLESTYDGACAKIINKV